MAYKYEMAIELKNSDFQEIETEINAEYPNENILTQARKHINAAADGTSIMTLYWPNVNYMKDDIVQSLDDFKCFGKYEYHAISIGESLTDLADYTTAGWDYPKFTSIKRMIVFG